MMCKWWLKKHLLILGLILVSFFIGPMPMSAIAADLHKDVYVGEYVSFTAAEIFGEIDLANAYPSNTGGYSQPEKAEGITAGLYLSDNSAYNYCYDIAMYDEHIIKFKATEAGLYTFNAFLWDLIWDENIPIKERVVEINVIQTESLSINNLDGDTATFLEGSANTCYLDQGIKASLSGVSSWDGVTLKLEFASGLANNEDGLAFDNTANGADGIFVGYTSNDEGIQGSYVKHEGKVIGSFSNTVGTNGNVIAMNLHFNSNATNEAISALMQNLYYINFNNDNPSNATRSVTYTLTDANSNTAKVTVYIEVVCLNDAPSFSGLDTIALESGKSILLGENIMVFDPELSAGNGNFNGAFLTILRYGGANDEDVFVAKAGGTLNPLVDTGALITNGVNIGTVTKNSTGTLILTFNANANNALLLSTIRQIAYSNTAESLSDFIMLELFFNDNNDLSQGIGGALSVSATLEIALEKPNKSPVVSEVAVSGIATIGEEVLATYVYNDEENDLDASTFKWYRYDDVIGNNKTEISGEIAKTYRLTMLDANKYISFEVTPVASTGTNTDIAQESALIGPIQKKGQAAIIYNMLGINKTYGDDTFTPLEPTGGSGNGLFSFASSDPAVASINALTGEVTIHKVGIVTLVATKAADSEYKNASQACELIINPKKLSISSIIIADKLYDTKTNALITNILLEGIIENDEVSPDTSAATAFFNDANYAYHKPVTVSGIALSGEDASNYVLPNGNFNTTGDILPLGTAIMPETNVASGAVSLGTKVALSCTTEGAAIYYTTDSEIPTAESTLYNDFISINTDVVIKAVAIKQGMLESPIMSVSYIVSVGVGGDSNNSVGSVSEKLTGGIAVPATSINENGQKITTLTVDFLKLKQIIENEGENAVIAISANADSDIVVGVLTAEMLKNMAETETVLELENHNIVYRVAASQIDIQALSENFGNNVSLSDVKVEIQIKEVNKDSINIIEDTSTAQGFTIIAPVVDFNITCSYGDKKLEIKNFNSYVERVLEIPQGIDPLKITTGIVVEANGTVYHVPTQVVCINGKYYAKINSLSNSIYTVVYHTVAFSDVTEHWAKNSINNMGSRMIINGVGNNQYAPEGAISRAEFAAIIVRAMGLQTQETANNFLDVENAVWYASLVNTAAAYTVINGYDDKTFMPNNNITREQVMVIIARAMAIVGLNSVLDEHDIAQELANYNDAHLVSDYAKAGVAACLKMGILEGKSNNILAPKADITRAEAAVMVERLLQKSGLI